MDPADADEQAVLVKLDRLSTLVFARDPAIVDELWSDLGFRLVGSEEGEIAETRDAVAAHMGILFAKPIRVCWSWDDRKVTRHGDVAWVFAEGCVEIVRPDHTAREPYRALCIFQKVDGRWCWRLFSGSEPVQSRFAPSDKL
jgi:hypothetical protein